ncbi:hypothetical protein EC957_008256 [Mortierella hygrophila]|uniref:Rhodanese domain-containing protein n=1 Tax=Mortierella hygrophila TaxID=979708 RepID=A0A9P6K609_9FUNG|nr:hypothetical protein EC957_008256 [Mortierella hygrophila]
MTDPQFKTAKNKAQNELLRQRQTGDGNWSCCDLTCDKAPIMFRHIAASHSDIVQALTSVQLANTLQLRASTSTAQDHRDQGQSHGQDEDAEFRSRRAEKYGSDPINLTCQCDPALGTVILFYAYLPISDPLAIARLHKAWFTDLELCGKVKLATEGINATLSGLSTSVTEYIDLLTALPEFESLNLSRPVTINSQHNNNTEIDATLKRKRFNFFKPTEGCRHVFGEEASIKVVEEICPLGAPELSVYHDPKNKQGKLPPKEFHAKLKESEGRDDYVVLDVRNYYESSIGRFPGAITPPIRKFSSFKDYVDRNRELLAGKTILSYCTGGIRCEKATSYMRQSLESGKSDDVKVLMLDGGIHNYLEWIKQERTIKENPQQESLWLAIYSTLSTMTSTADSQWYYQKEEFYGTPSQISGLSFPVEKESRHKGIAFIMMVGMHLKLPQLTMATAALFFQRFYMRRSFKDYKYYDVAATCIYLASKTEESTRKFKDIVIACAQKAAKKDSPIDDSSKEFRVWKDTIIYTEELLLETLCFDLSVEHPYHFLLNMFSHYQKDSQRGRKLKQVAWAFVNDSLRTTLCLTKSPKIVALAALYVAGKYLDENLMDSFGEFWRESYEPHEREIHEAAGEIMDSYLMTSNRNGRSLDKIPPGSKPGSEYQENGTPSYGGYLNSPAKLATPVYGMDPDRPANGDRSMAP